MAEVSESAGVLPSWNFDSFDSIFRTSSPVTWKVLSDILNGYIDDLGVCDYLSGPVDFETSHSLIDTDTDREKKAEIFENSQM